MDDKGSALSNRRRTLSGPPEGQPAGGGGLTLFTEARFEADPCPLTGHFDVATFGTPAAARAGNPPQRQLSQWSQWSRCLPAALAGPWVSARAGHGRHLPRGRPRLVLRAELLVKVGGHIEEGEGRADLGVKVRRGPGEHALLGEDHRWLADNRLREVPKGNTAQPVPFHAQLRAVHCDCVGWSTHAVERTTSGAAITVTSEGRAGACMR